MSDSTLDIWKKLQDEGYFKNHPLYKKMEMGIPHCVEMPDIIGKNVVEIGCGYGRDTVLLSTWAKRVYAIDVSQKILNDASDYIHGLTDKNNISFVLAEKYKSSIPNNSIHFVYALHVFQHLHPIQAQEYINNFYQKLVKGGKILIQFYLGTDKIIEEGKEPRVQYTREEALALFPNYNIERIWKLEKFNAENKLQYEHLYIIARK